MKAPDTGQARQARYRDSVKGKATITRYETSPHRRLQKQLAAMTRIREATVGSTI